MIVKKTWTKTLKPNKYYTYFEFKGDFFKVKEYHYVGYFFLGIIPLYITRQTFYSRQC